MANCLLGQATATHAVPTRQTENWVSIKDEDLNFSIHTCMVARLSPSTLGTYEDSPAPHKDPEV